MRHVVPLLGAPHGRSCVRGVFGKGWLGLMSCPCCSACDILSCQPFDLASVCVVVPLSDSPFLLALKLMQNVKSRSSLFVHLPPPNSMKNAASGSAVHQSVSSITLTNGAETEDKGFGLFES